MNFLNYRMYSTFRFAITCLTVLFLLNILFSFSSSGTHIKRTDDQNIVFLELNSSTNILIDNVKTDKRIFDGTTEIEDIRSYLDNSLNTVFNKYYASIKNSLSKSKSSRPFITVIYSTDI